MIDISWDDLRVLRNDGRNICALSSVERDSLGRTWLREKIGPVNLEEMSRDIGAVGWLVRTLADALDGGQEDTDAN